MRKYRLRPFYFGAIGLGLLLSLAARYTAMSETAVAYVMLAALVLAMTGWVLSLMTARCPRCKTMLPLKGALRMENCPYCKRYLQKKPKVKQGKE